MLWRVLREIFSPGTPAAPPGSKPGYDWQVQDLVNQGNYAGALVLYDAAVAAGIHSCDEEFDAAYRRALQATGTSPAPLRRRSRFFQLYRLLAEVLPIEGEIAECGCYRGLSSHLMLGRLRQADAGFTGRGYHVFDSFQGLSDPGAEDLVTGEDVAAERVRRMCRPGWFAAPLDLVRQGLAEFPDVSYHPGWIPASLQGQSERPYRFVHLDLDLHDPTLGALEYFYPRTVEGGIVVCDDFNWPGARLAIERFCARNGATFETTPHGQAVLRRAA